MTELESRIDLLYQIPLKEFVPARAACARTLTGADAQRVKTLKKPTLVPWAVNQVFWHARPFYQRLIESGRALRAAQVSALKGSRGTADIHGAAERHRKAVTDAVQESSRLASLADLHPSGELLARMLEAVSLLPGERTVPGRWTTMLQPQGFEALAGVAVKPDRRETHPSRSTLPSRATPRERARLERQLAAVDRRKRAALQKAETAVHRATAAELRAREAWRRAKQELQNAEEALAALRTT